MPRRRRASKGRGRKPSQEWAVTPNYQIPDYDATQDSHVPLYEGRPRSAYSRTAQGPLGAIPPGVKVKQRPSSSRAPAAGSGAAAVARLRGSPAPAGMIPVPVAAAASPGITWQQSGDAKEMQIIRSVLLRESYLEVLQQMVPSLAEGGVAQPSNLSNLVWLLREVTVEVVEAVSRWRVEMQSPQPFLYKGENYLLKLADDLNFLNIVPAFVEWLGYDCWRNPFLTPQALNSASPPRRKGAPAHVGGVDAVRLRAVEKVVLAEIELFAGQPSAELSQQGSEQLWATAAGRDRSESSEAAATLPLPQQTPQQPPKKLRPVSAAPRSRPKSGRPRTAKARPQSAAAGPRRSSSGPVSASGSVSGEVSDVSEEADHDDQDDHDDDQQTTKPGPPPTKPDTPPGSPPPEPTPDPPEQQDNDLQLFESSQPRHKGRLHAMMRDLAESRREIGAIEADVDAMRAELDCGDADEARQRSLREDVSAAEAELYHRRLEAARKEQVQASYRSSLEAKRERVLLARFEELQGIAASVIQRNARMWAAQRVARGRREQRDAAVAIQSAMRGARDRRRVERRRFVEREARRMRDAELARRAKEEELREAQAEFASQRAELRRVERRREMHERLTMSDEDALSAVLRHVAARTPPPEVLGGLRRALAEHAPPAEGSALRLAEDWDPAPESEAHQEGDTVPLRDLSAREVGRVLAALGLAAYAPRFAELGVDGSMLLDCTDEDLAGDLGVGVRLHRKKLLRFVARAQSEGVVVPSVSEDPPEEEPEEGEEDQTEAITLLRHTFQHLDLQRQARVVRACDAEALTVGELKGVTRDELGVRLSAQQLRAVHRRLDPGRSGLADGTDLLHALGAADDDIAEALAQPGSPRLLEAERAAQRETEARLAAARAEIDAAKLEADRKLAAAIAAEAQAREAAAQEARERAAAEAAAAEAAVREARARDAAALEAQQRAQHDVAAAEAAEAEAKAAAARAAHAVAAATATAAIDAAREQTASTKKLLRMMGIPANELPEAMASLSKSKEGAVDPALQRQLQRAISLQGEAQAAVRAANEGDQYVQLVNRDSEKHARAAAAVEREKEEAERAAAEARAEAEAAAAAVARREAAAAAAAREREERAAAERGAEREAQRAREQAEAAARVVVEPVAPELPDDAVVAREAAERARQQAARDDELRRAAAEAEAEALREARELQAEARRQLVREQAVVSLASSFVGELLGHFAPAPLSVSVADPPADPDPEEEPDAPEVVLPAEERRRRSRDLSKQRQQHKRRLPKRPEKPKPDISSADAAAIVGHERAAVLDDDDLVLVGAVMASAASEAADDLYSSYPSPSLADPSAVVDPEPVPQRSGSDGAFRRPPGIQTAVPDNIADGQTSPMSGSFLSPSS